MVQKVMSAQEADEIAAVIAAAVETVPPERQVLFLVKLSMALAALVADRARITEAIRLARHED